MKSEGQADLPCFRVDSSEICALVKIAVDTCKGEILEPVSASVNLRQNVFNVKNRQRRIDLVKAAVFTSVSGAFPHTGFCPRTHKRPAKIPLVGELVFEGLRQIYLLGHSLRTRPVRHHLAALPWTFRQVHQCGLEARDLRGNQLRLPFSQATPIQAQDALPGRTQSLQVLQAYRGIASNRPFTFSYTHLSHDLAPRQLTMPRWAFYKTP